MKYDLRMPSSLGSALQVHPARPGRLLNIFDATSCLDKDLALFALAATHGGCQASAWHRIASNASQYATGDSHLPCRWRGIMDHPSIPDKEAYASVWRTDLHRHLNMRAYLAQMIYIEQWPYGASSVKPTVLRGLGLPKLAQHIHMCRQHGLTRPTAVLTGYDRVDKCFRTSAAKEHPPRLCEALVRASFLSLRQRIRRSGFSYV